MYSTRLKVALSNKGMKPAVLAYRLGVDRSTISNYLNGRYKAKIEMVRKIASILGVSADWLSGMDVPMDEITTLNSNMIPVLGKVAAGIPITAVEDILDYEEISPDLLRDGSEYFALQLKGDSMEPRMRDGDVVIVRKQETIENGEIGIVCVNGDDATCKKVIRKDTGAIVLPPLPKQKALIFLGFLEISRLFSFLFHSISHRLTPFEAGFCVVKM